MTEHTMMSTLTFPNQSASAGILEEVSGNYALNPTSSEIWPHNFIPTAISPQILVCQS